MTEIQYFIYLYIFIECKNIALAKFISDYLKCLYSKHDYDIKFKCYLVTFVITLSLKIG